MTSTVESGRRRGREVVLDEHKICGAVELRQHHSTGDHIPNTIHKVRLCKSFERYGLEVYEEWKEIDSISRAKVIEELFCWSRRDGEGERCQRGRLSQFLKELICFDIVAFEFQSLQ